MKKKLIHDIINLQGGDYNDLPDTFIIFLCTFDYLEKGLPVYTIKPYCTETKQEFTDGTTKIIVNSTASEQAEEIEKL